MGKLKQRFDALPSTKRFAVAFFILLAICLPAIPITIHSDHRILQHLSDTQFALFTLLLCIGYAALLAGAGHIGEIIVKRRHPKGKSNM